MQSKPLSLEFAKAVNYSSDVASHQSSLMTVFGRKGNIIPFMMFMYCLLQLRSTYSVCVVTFSSDFTVCTSLFSVSVFGSSKYVLLNCL